jgi:hypothetical protein
MTAMSKTASKRTGKTPEKQATALHLASSLLHSVRRVMQHEDELCTFVHEIKQAGEISPAVAEDLRHLLDSLPGQGYLDDLIALRHLTDSKSPEPSPQKTIRKANPKKN